MNTSVFKTRAALTVALWVCLADAASAHPISITEVFAYVTRDAVTIKLEAFAEDLYFFHNLKADENDALSPESVKLGIEKHKQFLLDRFIIRDVQGVRLKGRVSKVIDFEPPKEGVPVTDLMQYKLIYHLEYDLAEPPEYLTFTQRMVDKRVTLPSEMQFHLKQEGAGSRHNALLLPDDPHTVRFDWDHPPLSSKESKEEWDRWYRRQREETMGITSYSSVYSFLYIEDFEVRHEILIPIATLKEDVTIRPADPAFVSVQEQEALRPAIAEHFTSGNPVEIDGKIVAPQVRRIEFYGLSLKDFAKQTEPTKVSMANGRVAVILAYPTRRPPDKVKLTWDLFNPFVWSVKTIVYSRDGVAKATLTRFAKKNKYEWNSQSSRDLPRPQPVSVALPPRRTFDVPVAGLLMLGALVVPVVGKRWQRASLSVAGLLLGVGLVTWRIVPVKISVPLDVPHLPRTEALDVFRTLHENVYRAFDFRVEEDVYDALDQSVAGDELTNLYLQVRESLVEQNQGGALARVEKVAVEKADSVEPSGAKLSSQGFAVDCRWTVAGTVEHWGHVHRRTNGYHGRFLIEPVKGQWKITSLDLLDEERLSSETTLRGFD